MIRIRVIFIIIFLFSSNLTLAQEGIYFIDVDKLLNNSNYGKKIVKKLKTFNSNNINEIKADEKKLEEIENEITKIKNIISEEELSKKIDNFKNKLILYRDKKDLKFKEYNELKNKELELFFKKITPIIEEFMAINSIKFIIEKKNLFIANSEYDKTTALIDYLNKNLNDD